MTFSAAIVTFIGVTVKFKFCFHEINYLVPHAVTKVSVSSHFTNGRTRIVVHRKWRHTMLLGAQCSCSYENLPKNTSLIKRPGTVLNVATETRRYYTFSSSPDAQHARTLTVADGRRYVMKPSCCRQMEAAAAFACFLFELNTVDWNSRPFTRT